MLTQRPIGAFDFDGTLTIRDSYNAFLAWRCGPWRLVLGALRLTPAALTYLLDRDRGRLKAAATRALLGGVSQTEMEADAERFAETFGRNFFRADAIRVWREWGERGAIRVIVTASPDLTVAPFARMLGAERLIGTRLATDDRDRITGALVGANCRGAEKVRRLREAFGETMSLEAAYGDSRGDTEMLAMAKTAGFKVFTRTDPGALTRSAPSQDRRRRRAASSISSPAPSCTSTRIPPASSPTSARRTPLTSTG
jgi:phosphatidylglycerophosphatase C